MRTLFLVAALVHTASAAIAADVTVENTPPPAVAQQPVFTWAGTHIGIHAGGGWSNGEFSGLGLAGTENANGGHFGAFAGYDYHFDNDLIAGIEGDFEHHWNNQELVSADFGTDWAGSLRGRFGYAFEHFLFYATAGWAGTRSYADVPSLGKKGNVFSGYTIGAGLDYAFNDNMFARIEYRYSDYGDKDLQKINVEVDQHTARVGLGVRF